MAVCTDEEKVRQLGRRDIVISWRGTIRNSEWVANFKMLLGPAQMDKRPTAGNAAPPSNVRVETGFLSLYTSKNPNTRYNRSSARTQVNPPLPPQEHLKARPELTQSGSLSPLNYIIMSWFIHLFISGMIGTSLSGKFVV